MAKILKRLKVGWGEVEHKNGKISLKILEKRECGCIQGLSKFFGYPLLSQERVKLRMSNFVCIFTGSIGLSEQKSIKMSGKIAVDV